MAWLSKRRQERRDLILGEVRVNLDEPRKCLVCKANLSPILFTGRQDIAQGVSWFGYKGAACRRCGYPFSPNVLVTEVEAPSREEVWKGKVHLLFRDLSEDKAKQYLETLDLVFQAVNFLIREEKISEILPPHARSSSVLTEQEGVPTWMANEMRRALVGHGSDLLVKVLNEAKAYHPGP